MSGTARQPTIRKGQRKPYVRATREQIRERIRKAGQLLDLGMYKSEIHQLFREEYGVVWRQADRYMARARELSSTGRGF